MRIALLGALVLCSCSTVRPTHEIDAATTAGLDFDRCLEHALVLSERTCDFEARLRYISAERATMVHFAFSRTGQLRNLAIDWHKPFAGSAEWTECLRRHMRDSTCQATAVADFHEDIYSATGWAPCPSNLASPGKT